MQETRIAAATSLGCASRCLGALAYSGPQPSLACGLSARNSAVSVGPGATAFSVMPRRLRGSIAIVRAILSSAAFAAA